MYTSNGLIRVEPKSKSTPLRPWWAVIECCPELSRYYLEKCRKPFWYVKCIQRPAWGGHISMIRGEEPPKALVAWQRLNGMELEFKYDGTIETDGKHFWLPVFCEKAGDIREALGLRREPEYPFHLTFGVVEG